MSRGITFGTYAEAPTIAAEVILDKYGKYTAYRKVIGGELQITDDLRAFLA